MQAGGGKGPPRARPGLSWAALCLAARGQSQPDAVSAATGLGDRAGGVTAEETETQKGREPDANSWCPGQVSACAHRDACVRASFC